MPSEGDSGLDGPAPKAQPEDTSDVGTGEDGMPLNPSDPHAVQFIPSSNPKNGDAKVELGEVGGVPKFVGLGKEELMKYANDPFWVRLRWILFILFWILWVAMLAGAIVIIVLAPKCSGKVADEVVADGPYYQVYLKSFTPNADKLTGLQEKAKYIKDLGVRTVIISQILNTSDFKAIDSSIHGGTDGQTVFKSLVAELKKEGIKVLLQIVPNHSSKTHKWFTEKPEYYVLKETADVAGSDWKSLNGGSAWTPLDTNGNQSYLHQFQVNEPDLNYGNKDLVKEMNEVLKFWYTEAEISGFLLSDVSYLVEDLSDLTNPNKTINQAENKKLLEELLDSSTWDIGTRTPPYALLDVDDLSGPEAIKQYSSKRFMPVLSDLVTELNGQFTPEELKEQIEGTDKTFVLRRMSSPKLDRLATKFGNERAYILQMVTLLLRGQVVVYYGDELGLGSLSSSEGNALLKNVGEMPVNIEDKTAHDYFTALVKLHNEIPQTADDAEEDTKLYAGEGIFAFKRGNHVVVANLGFGTRRVNLTDVLGVTKTGKVVITTPGGSSAEPALQDAPPIFNATANRGYVFAYEEDKA